MPVGFSTEKTAIQADAFVDIAAYSEGRVAVDMKYAAANRPGAVTVAYMRREVADRLLKAADRLPKGWRFLVYDAWRPYSVQRSLYDEYFDDLASRPAYANCTQEELHAMARTFVSFPDRTKEISYVHSSGGAIDLTLLTPDGKEADMGCGFDDFTSKAAMFALEDGEPSAAQGNRRLLYTVMTDAGFTNYEPEWWHYDYGDVFWANQTGNAVLYTSVYEEPKGDA